MSLTETTVHNRTFAGPARPATGHDDSSRLTPDRLIPDRLIPDRRNLTTALLRPLLDRIRTGHLRIQLPDGRVMEHRGQEGAGGPVAEIHLHRWTALARIATGGGTGAAEAYVDGDWSTPDLAACLRVAADNLSTLQPALQGSVWRRMGDRVLHALNANTRTGSRRNIARHYDLGNDFYRLWLDPGMTYSSALFDETGEAGTVAESTEDGGTALLTAGQDAKFRATAALAGIQPGDRVLEIGCGWGGFAAFAARDLGATIDGITLSTEQLAFGRERLRRAGLDDRARLSLTDYRDMGGTYDRIVSIEMFEAVGESRWDSWFRTVRDRLAPGGAAAVQVITIDDRAFAAYRERPDFIQRHIFPGGMLPSPAAFRAAAARAGLRIDAERFFGPGYERTLRLWQQRFEAAWPAISRLPGFDERFRRLWNWYLLYCAEGFRTGRTDVGLFRLVHA